MTVEERCKDSKEVLEILRKLPVAIQATLVCNFPAIEMAYQAGFNSGMKAAKEDVA